jgi:hypothetical protein
MVLAFHSLFKYRERPNEVAPIIGKLNGVRKIAFSKPLCIAEAFEKAKRNRASLTDVILTAITLTFGEIIRSQNTIQVSVPFTLRDFPKDLKSLKVNNDFACLPKLLRFPTKDGQRVEIFESDQLFKDTFLAKLREVNQDIRSVKSKFMALGWYFMMKYFLFLLRVPMNNNPWTVADTYTSVVSIVPGKREPYIFDFKNLGTPGI